MLLQPIATHATDWDPASVSVTLNVTLDAGFVQSGQDGSTRLDTASLVVLDRFLDEPQRQGLLSAITAPSWDHQQGPPPDKWDTCTQDRPDAARTWGLRPDVLAHLEASNLPAKLEVQSRLAKLYPEFTISHQPSDAIQGPGGVEACNVEQSPPGTPASPPRDHLVPGPRYDCHALLANAAVCGDEYAWHQDADPQTFPLCTPFTRAHGQYTNRDPGRPLFVSLLLYLNEAWPRDWAAETLFLDSPTDTGILVRPKPYRAVLMDQDVVHRLLPPARRAGGQPRYSLVWKLVFEAKRAGQRVSIAKPEWGLPDAFGSSARAQAIVKQLAARRSGGPGPQV